MAIGVTNKQYYENIADAIREKNGSNSLYKPSEMAQAILDIESGGGGGDITDPVEYRRVHRDKGYPYIPLPSEMKDTTGSYYEANDCIYMLYDARGEMANPAFKLTYSNASGVAYKYRAGANYLTPSTQITANRIISFTLDGVTYKFVAKSNHPTTCKMRIDKGILRFYENNVMVEQVPITTKGVPTNKDLVNDLTNTTWGLPTTPTLPNVTTSNANEYWVNFTSQNQTFDLMQLYSSQIHYINTTTGNEVLAYDSGWTTGYNSISFTGGDDAKLSWLVNWVCAGTLITETSETITVTSSWQDAYLVSQANITLASSGSTTYLTYYYGDSDYNNYDYVLIKLNGTITEHDISVKEKFDNVTYNSKASSEILEVSGKCASCNISVVGDSSYKCHQHLEYYSFDGVSSTSMSYMFSSCGSLQVIPELDTSSVTNMSYMFQNCYSLQTIPELDTSSVTNMSSMFTSCHSLQIIPELDTSSVTNMDGMFSSCGSLQVIPELDTSSVTNMSYMFYSCYSLQVIPKLDTSSVTNMSYMFQNCYSLQTIPELDTSSVTNMSSMFTSCYSLQVIPELDTSSVTNMSSMLQNCYSLQTIPELDTSSVTNMSSMFQNCYSLQTIPELDTSSVTNMSYMFYSCYSLQVIPKLDTHLVTSMGSMFQNCYLLQKCGIYDSKKAFSLSNSTMLPQSELVNILQNLGVVSTATTLTLGSTNLNKLSADEKAIATKKGWTLA